MISTGLLLCRRKVDLLSRLVDLLSRPVNLPPQPIGLLSQLGRINYLVDLLTR